MRVLLAALSLVLPLVPPFAAHAAGVAFVVNSNAASISVVDMATMQEVRRIPTLREPHHLTISPDRKSLLVGDTAGNQMMFLDPASGEVQKRVAVADPYQLIFSPDGKILTVAGLARNQVDVYDYPAMTLRKRFPAKSTPSHIAYSPDGATVFVTLQDSDKLMAIDLRKMEPKWTQPIGKTPAGVMWHNGKVLVANMGTDYVAIADPADGRVVGKIVTGKGAHNLFLSPDNKTLWVNNRAGGTTVAVNATTLKIERTYQISGGPDDIDFAADGKLWITRRWAEKVAVLDPATGQIETVNVGRSPHGLFLNPKAPAPSR